MKSKLFNKGLGAAFLACFSLLVLSGTADVRAQNGSVITEGAQRNESYVRPCPETLHLEVTVRGVSAAGMSDGALEVNVSGGMPPYTCQWSTPGHVMVGENIDQLNEGEFYLQVVDANGCDATWSGRLGRGEVTSVTAGTPPAAQLWVAPNPARDYITIHYDLQASGVVSLEIHDRLGRHIATPINARQASGEHAVGLDVATLGAGVYHCQLRVAGELVTGSFVIQR